LKQLVQKLLDGSMDVLDVPVPMLGPGMVRVRNRYSLISVGTERSTVSAARDSLVGKARAKPEQVRQVIETLKQQGPLQTYRAVMKKLDSYSPLGYSSAGIVTAVADDVRGVRVGDRVACAGAGYANHAEVVAVPANLCVVLPNEAELALAAYNTVGAIALQGVRQADLRLGETCVVLGMGLLGHLTALILRASGIRVFGIDVRSSALEQGLKHCLDDAAVPDDPGLPSRVAELSRGIGADAVIITAATKSLEPINLAGKPASSATPTITARNSACGCPAPTVPAGTTWVTRRRASTTPLPTSVGRRTGTCRPSRTCFTGAGSMRPT